MYDSPVLNDRPHGSMFRYAARLVSYLAGAALLAATILPMTARADDQDTIDYREHIMKTMGAEMVLINQIVQKKAPADGLATFTQGLAMTAATAKSAFATKMAGGEAKPDVWTHWADFSKRLDALAAATEDLANSSKGGDITAAASKVATLGCKGCHDVYRQKTK